MLSKIKRLLVVGVAALSIAFIAPVAANACYGPDCEQYTADNTTLEGPSQVGFGNEVLVVGDDYVGGASVADATLSGIVESTGEDYWTTERTYHPSYWTTEVTGKLYKKWIPGHWKWTHSHGKQWVEGKWTYKKFPSSTHTHGWTFVENVYERVYHRGYTTTEHVFHKGFADVSLDLEMEHKTPTLSVISNGPQESGLAYTIAKTSAKLTFNGLAVAEGTGGCPQYAALDLAGSLTAHVNANATVNGPFGNQAWAGGSGFTTVSFVAHDSEYDHNGPVADADLSGHIHVNQGILATAYVNGDGSKTITFATIGTGNASEHGDAHITGINSSGMVGQSAYATNGQGAYAQGNSTASYNNVSNGFAVVAGFNNVVTNSNGTTVTSHQTAHAGGYGGGSPQ